MGNNKRVTEGRAGNSVARKGKGERMGLKSDPIRVHLGVGQFKFRWVGMYAWRQKDEVWKIGCDVNLHSFGATIAKNCLL